MIENEYLDELDSINILATWISYDYHLKIEATYAEISRIGKGTKRQSGRSNKTTSIEVNLYGK